MPVIVCGRKPSLTPVEAMRVRTIGARRAKLMAQLAALRAELDALPSQHQLAAEYGVARATINNTAHERHDKHHRVEARAAQESAPC